MELPSFQTFEWYESAMVFRVLFFIFLFETTGKKKNLNQNDFRHGYSNYFKSAILEVT